MDSRTLEVYDTGNDYETEMIRGSFPNGYKHRHPNDMLQLLDEASYQDEDDARSYQSGTKSIRTEVDTSR